LRDSARWFEFLAMVISFSPVMSWLSQSRRAPLR
jgi:hypothetical protein